MSAELVHFTVSDAIAQITLDRAPVNALSMPLIDALLGALEKARDDASVRAVIICSAHKVFCAGLDLDIVRGKRGTETKLFLERLYFALNDVQYRMGKPTIAAVDGPARAGGMTIAISCDMIIAGEGATFGYPEIDLGLVPAIHFVHLPRIVGRHRAFELLFSGRSFGAAEAAALGLVSRVVPDATLRAEARAMARAFAEKPRTAKRLARAAFLRANDDRRGIAEAVANFCDVAATAEAQEGMRAFIEKRALKW